MSIEGKHILTTRAGDSNDEFESVLISHGAYVESFPTIEILPVENYFKLDEILNSLNTYDGIFFTSANGVRFFFERAVKLKITFSGKMYAVGIKTRRQLEKYGYESSFVPQNYSADDMLNEINKDEIKNKRFLFPRGNLSMESIGKRLAKYSQIEEVIVYQTLCPNYQETHIKWIKDIIGSNGVDCISFFSPSSIQNFYSLMGAINIDKSDVAVIGNTTLSKAKEFGLNVEIVPDRSTSENLANAIVDFYNTKN